MMKFFDSFNNDIKEYINEQEEFLSYLRQIKFLRDFLPICGKYSFDIVYLRFKDLRFKILCYSISFSSVHRFRDKKLYRRQAQW